ncbi:hypothetical protein ACFL3T_02275 [Patescibacteria group bacterium]
MPNTLPGLSQNPKKQFDSIGKFLKDNFDLAKGKGVIVVHDKALEKQKNVRDAVVSTQVDKGGYYFEVAINLKTPVNGFRQFSYQLWFNKRGVCSFINLPSKFKNKFNPFPLNFKRMMVLLKRNTKALKAKMVPKSQKIAER